MTTLRLFTALLIFSGSAVFAHEHVEVGFDAAPNRNRLAFFGSENHTATYFPSGEAPSGNFLVFPGATYATELTFSAFDNIDNPPGNAFVSVQVLSVAGPSGATFSFWEAGAASPSWTRPTGWTSAPGDQPSFPVSEDTTGYGHVHGRAFSFSSEGEYVVSLRAVDGLGNFAASLPFVVRFTVLSPPRLGIGAQGGRIRLSFTGRANLVYDIQSSTTLAPGSWTTVDTLDGNGAALEWTEPLNNRPRIFYRIVEYQ